MTQWHQLFKPLAMLLAIGSAAARLKLPARRSAFGWLLVAGLAFSLFGDCLLLFPGFFIPGLIAFLIAHLCYTALFKQGLPWFPSRAAMLGTLGSGAAMYAFLFPGLSGVLRVAVGAYVVVIALMAAQAIGRAVMLQDRHALAAGAGALLFMLSDSLLATNKFAFALPMAQFWILATYYAAQILIACNARPVRAGTELQSGNNSPALLGGVTPR